MEKRIKKIVKEELSEFNYITSINIFSDIILIGTNILYVIKENDFSILKFTK